jgi:hypothetical protein
LPASYFARTAWDEKVIEATKKHIERSMKFHYQLGAPDQPLAPGAGAPPAWAIAPTPPPAPSTTTHCQYGGPCCSMTGVRCIIPGLPCGGCTAEQAAQARAILGI